MKIKLFQRALTVVTVSAGMFATLPAPAQQINGTPWVPPIAPRRSLDGNQLPPPSLPFGGVIKESARDHACTGRRPWCPSKGAPNVLLIMTDDQGYGVCSTFGGVIPTPTMDRIAAAGLRYTQFHSTALCSPTRAALITGRKPSFGRLRRDC